MTEYFNLFFYIGEGKYYFVHSFLPLFNINLLNKYYMSTTTKHCIEIKWQMDRSSLSSWGNTSEGGQC